MKIYYSLLIGMLIIGIAGYAIAQTSGCIAGGVNGCPKPSPTVEPR